MKERRGKATKLFKLKSAAKVTILFMLLYTVDVEQNVPVKQELD